MAGFFEFITSDWDESDGEPFDFKPYVVPDWLDAQIRARQGSGGGGQKPPKPPRKRGPWDDDDGDGGNPPPRRCRYQKTAFELECERQNQKREDELNAFAKHVLPMLFPGTKGWKCERWGLPRQLEIISEEKSLMDHVRTFVPGGSAKSRARARAPKFVVITMPYPNRTRLPVTGTALAKKWTERHWRNARTHRLRYYALPPELSWHLPGRTEIWLMVPEDGVQPVKWHYSAYGPETALADEAKELLLQRLRRRRPAEEYA
jgi:hypothetical protein